MFRLEIRLEFDCAGFLSRHTTYLSQVVNYQALKLLPTYTLFNLSFGFQCPPQQREPLCSGKKVHNS